MTKQSKRLVTVNLADERELGFNSADELIGWSAQEQEAWAWIQQATSIRRQAQDCWNRFESFHNAIRQSATVYKSDSNLEAFQDKLNRAAEQVRVKRVAVRGTVHGDKIFAVLQKNGGATDEQARVRGVVALNTFSPSGGEDTTPVMMQMFKSSLPALIDYYGETGGSRAAENAVAEMLRRASEELEKRQAELDTCVERYRSSLEAWSDDVRGAIGETADSANAAIADIHAVRDTYQSQMGLQAPVQYWLDKAAKHRKAAGTYRNVLIVFSALALIGCVAAYLYVFHEVITGAVQIENSVSASLLSFGGLALLTTAALWMARILTRLYLSQHHLSIDSDERATMVTTYLALINQGAASDQERAIVLSALFRPTADGIVKDEAPPVASPAAVLSNLVMPGSR